LLEEGTRKEGAIRFAEALENRAIHFSAAAGRETLVLSVESLADQFPFALEKLHALLRDPNFTPDAFAKVQTQRLGELERKKSDLDYVAAMQLRSVLFEGTPLEHPDLGTEESVRSMTLQQVQDYLLAHMKLGNLIVVAGGDLTPETIETALRKLLDPLEPGTVDPIRPFEASDKGRSKTRYEETDQAYIYFGSPYHMDLNDTRRVLGKVAAYILGSGGFGSRLMEEVRVKRGLAYSAYGRFMLGRSYHYFSGYLQTKIASADEAIGVVRSVIDDFLAHGATEEELEAAKKFFLGSEPLRTETLSQRMNRAFREYYDGLGLGWSQKELEMIRTMKLNDLNAFIQAHPEIGRLSWSIVTKKGKR
ncbi:M16 family metallopeptidase, partial [Nitratifractor sp.]